MITNVLYFNSKHTDMICNFNGDELIGFTLQTNHFRQTE
jgi:hypothetical protein